MFRTIAIAGLGSVLEYFDFTIFLFLSAPLGRVFFDNSSSPFLKQLEMTGILAMGYLARPLGGFLFSHFSDRNGRIQTFSYSILCMGISTLLIGLLPSYAQVGILAPILLIILRLIQGMSFGGEFSSAMVYVAEHHYENNSGKACAYLVSLTNIGLVLSGLLVTSFVHFFGQEKIEQFLWRVPFLLGGIAAFAGLYFRKNLKETKIFESLKGNAKIEQFPIVHLCRHYSREVFMGFGLGSIIAISGTLFYVYLPCYLAEKFSYPLERVTFISTLSVVFLSLTSIYVAHLSDKKDIRKIFLWTSALSIFATYPIFFLFSYNDIALVVLAYFLICCVFSNSMIAFILMIRIYPSQVRTSGFSFSYNVTSAFFSGSIPLICTYLLEVSENKYAPAFYSIAASIIGLSFFLFFFNDKIKNRLLETA